jgi:hypothetical protein
MGAAAVNAGSASGADGLPAQAASRQQSRKAKRILVKEGPRGVSGDGDRQAIVLERHAKCMADLCKIRGGAGSLLR